LFWHGQQQAVNHDFFLRASLATAIFLAPLSSHQAIVSYFLLAAAVWLEL
jgi:hypothetical protein